MKNRKRVFLAGVAVGLVLFPIGYAGIASVLGNDRKLADARMGIKAIAKASYHYNEEYGAWPSRFDFFTRNPKNMVFLLENPRSLLTNHGLDYAAFDQSTGTGVIKYFGDDTRWGTEDDLRFTYGSDGEGAFENPAESS